MRGTISPANNLDKVVEQVLRNTSSGGAIANDVLMHAGGISSFILCLIFSCIKKPPQ